MITEHYIKYASNTYADFAIALKQNPGVRPARAFSIACGHVDANASEPASEVRHSSLCADTVTIHTGKMMRSPPMSPGSRLEGALSKRGSAVAEERLALALDEGPTFMDR